MNFKENFEILKRKHPEIYKQIESVNEDDSIKVLKSKVGDAVPTYSFNKKELFIHSKFDPYKESERFIGQINTEIHDLYLLLGFGFAYHVEELIKRVGPQCNIIVIEKKPLMIKKALESRDLQNLLNDKRLVLLIDPDEESISKALKGKSSAKVNFITHRGSHQVEPQYYNNILEVARSHLSTKDVNIATLSKFEKIWNSNIARNIINFIKSPGTNIFYDKFRNIPCIIVGAGPSLHSSIYFIKENINRAIVIAVDTSYKILLKNGIVPHFCICVDPQVVNARFFEGVEPGETILVADPVVHPTVPRFFKGRFITTGIAFDLLKWIEKVSGQKGEISHGGSVSTNAYDFGRRLGSSPLVLVGQDLSFTRGHAHCKGSYLDEQVHLKTNRTYTIEMFNRFQLTALPKIFVKGKNGRNVHTNQKMMIFLSWFEKQNDKNLINATVEGAMMKGVKNIDQEEIVFQEIVDPWEKIEKLISQSTVPGPIDDVKNILIKKINNMLNDLRDLLPILEKGIGFSDNLGKIMAEEKRDKGKVDYIIKKLEDIDEVVKSKENIKDMISFTIQRVVHTITEGYEIDGEDEKMDEDVLIAKRSEFLYKGLLEGAIFNQKTLGKMKVLLEREL
jgi:hypothetical protein